MIFKNSRCTEKEWLDDFSLSGPDLEKNLYNLGLVNRFLGGNRVITKALAQIIRQQPDLAKKRFTLPTWVVAAEIYCERSLSGLIKNP